MHPCVKAGLLRQPVKVKTELNVKTSNTQGRQFENSWLGIVKTKKHNK